jgi:hypothetical protein
MKKQNTKQIVTISNKKQIKNKSLEKKTKSKIKTHKKKKINLNLTILFFFKKGLYHSL